MRGRTGNSAQPDGPGRDDERLNAARVIWLIRGKAMAYRREGGLHAWQRIYLLIGNGVWIAHIWNIRSPVLLDHSCVSEIGGGTAEDSQGGR